MVYIRSGAGLSCRFLFLTPEGSTSDKIKDVWRVWRDGKSQHATSRKASTAARRCFTLDPETAIRAIMEAGPHPKELSVATVPVVWTASGEE